MDIVKIKMMCNWMSGKELCEYWNKFTDGNYTYSKNNKKIKIFGEDLNCDEADYIVVINNSNDYICTEQNLSKTIFAKMEPIFVSDFWKNIDACFLKAKIVHGTDDSPAKNVMNRNLPEWLISIPKKELENSNYFEYKIKNNRISSVISGKKQDEGQIIRINFALFAQNYIEWDNFGHNSHSLLWNNYLGSIEHKEKALIPYKYSFNCENTFINGYITEKLIDCILCETLCFYYGCPNVTEFIDENAFVLLDLGRDTDSNEERNIKWTKAVEKIKDSIENNLWEKKLPNIKAEKKKILQETSMFPTIFNLIFNQESKPSFQIFP
jgi:hypothetical protein